MNGTKVSLRIILLSEEPCSLLFTERNDTCQHWEVWHSTSPVEISMLVHNLYDARIREDLFLEGLLEWKSPRYNWHLVCKMAACRILNSHPDAMYTKSIWYTSFGFVWDPFACPAQNANLRNFVYHCSWKYRNLLLEGPRNCSKHHHYRQRSLLGDMRRIFYYF